MLMELCHKNVCESELVHMGIEAKTFTKEKKIVFEIKITKNNGSSYVIKRSHQALEQLRKSIKKVARDFSLKKVLGIQNKIKKLLLKQDISSKLQHFEELMNQLLVFEEIRNSKILKEFVVPDDWICSECLSNIKQTSHSKENKLNFNESVVSGPFHYPKYRVTKNDGIQLKQAIPSIDDVVEVFEKDPSGWWQVLYKTKLICFPSSYLKPELSKSQSDDATAPLETPQIYVAKKSYGAVKDDEISFGEGDLVNVIEKKYDGWWIVEFQNKRGVAPAVFLEQTTSGGSGPQTNLCFSNETIESCI